MGWKKDGETTKLGDWGVGWTWEELEHVGGSVSSKYIAGNSWITNKYFLNKNRLGNEKVGVGEGRCLCPMFAFICILFGTFWTFWDQVSLCKPVYHQLTTFRALVCHRPQEDSFCSYSSSRSSTSAVILLYPKKKSSFYVCMSAVVHQHMSGGQRSPFRTFRSQFSLPILWVQGIKSWYQAWRQGPLPHELLWQPIGFVVFTEHMSVSMTQLSLTVIKCLWQVNWEEERFLVAPTLGVFGQWLLGCVSRILARQNILVGKM